MFRHKLESIEGQMSVSHIDDEIEVARFINKGTEVKQKMFRLEIEYFETKS